VQTLYKKKNNLLQQPSVWITVQKEWGEKKIINGIADKSQQQPPPHLEQSLHKPQELIL